MQKTTVKKATKNVAKSTVKTTSKKLVKSTVKPVVNAINATNNITLENAKELLKPILNSIKERVRKHIESHPVNSAERDSKIDFITENAKGIISGINKIAQIKGVTLESEISRLVTIFNVSNKQDKRYLQIKALAKICEGLNDIGFSRLVRNSFLYHGFCAYYNYSTVTHSFLTDFISCRLREDREQLLKNGASDKYTKGTGSTQASQVRMVIWCLELGLVNKCKRNDNSYLFDNFKHLVGCLLGYEKYPLAA